MPLHEVNDNEPKRALLVGVQLPSVNSSDLDQSLNELSRLVQTLGLKVVGRTSQRRPSEGGATVIGGGKVKEIAELTGGTGEITEAFGKQSKAAQKSSADRVEQEGADEDTDPDVDDRESALTGEGEETDDFDNEEGQISNEESRFSAQTPSARRVEFTGARESAKDSGGDGGGDSGARKLEVTEKPNTVVFDCELSPSQIRNLEKAFGVPVLDRTGVIIEIFSRHARTRAARLQVEIARLTYTAPRVRESAGSGDRQGGGVGGKGAGESDVELDRRKIRDRIKELKDEFENIEREFETRRARRSEIRCVALVGYTNAGKSSMMRALTASEVLIADKLFATLDTTVRPLDPPTVPQILISDTVGFIKKLPHDLVASFKSTLDEALNATLLLYVVDCSDPSFRAQFEVTRKVLAEVGAGQSKSRLILNKVDRIDSSLRAALRTEFPDAVLMSTKDANDVEMLRKEIIRFFEGEMIEQELFVPYDVQGAIGEIRSRMRVLDESYDGGGVRLSVRTTEVELARVKAKFSI
jgi:GTP-binding protein HflX